MAIGFLTLMILAVSLIALSMSQFVAVGIASGRAQADVRSRRATDLRGLRQAAQVARLSSQLSISLGSSSVQWRVMEVAEIINESHDCRSYYLVDPYRQPLPDFRPGQHLMVRPALAGAYQTTRCYSLSSSPDTRFWRITVKRQSPAKTSVSRSPALGSTGNSHKPVGPQQGGLSVWLHETIGVGDCLLIGGPNGNFYLSADNPRPLVLLAAGVGVTPMASMLRWSMENTPNRQVRLFYQAQDTRHWPLGPSLHDWTRKFPSCQVASFFSRATADDLTELLNCRPPAVENAAEFQLGKFDASQVLRSLPGQDCDYFLCGPNAWMERLRTDLMAAGVAEERLHRESFGAPSNAKTTDKPPRRDAVAVSFEASGVNARWISPEQSLWELAREHQVEIPSGCLNGVCGSCRVKLLAGQVAYDRDVSIELAADECLACIAHPLTDCRIDV